MSSIVDVICHVGSQSIKVQNLDTSLLQMEKSEEGSELTFTSDQPFTLEGPDKLGLALWMPRDKVKAALAEVEKGRGYTQDLVDRIEAAFDNPAPESDGGTTPDALEALLEEAVTVLRRGTNKEDEREAMLQDAQWAMTQAEEKAERYRQALCGVGVCPDCLQEPQHHMDEPFSTCGCGTGEDYSYRPTQRLHEVEQENKQLMEHIVRLEKDLEEDAHMQADAYRQAVDKIDPYVQRGKLPASLDASLYCLLEAFDRLEGLEK